MKSDELTERKETCILSPRRQETLQSAAEQY